MPYSTSQMGMQALISNLPKVKIMTEQLGLEPRGCISHCMSLVNHSTGENRVRLHVSAVWCMALLTSWRWPTIFLYKWGGGY